VGFDMKKKNISVGLIGSRFMGKAHSNAFAKLNMFFNSEPEIIMKSICGLEEDEVKSMAERFHWERYETSWEKLVKQNDIDMISIATPTNLHKEMAITAANEGKHVFCEKPLAANLSDAREMLEAVNKCGVKHQIGFNYRFAPAVMLAKKLIDDGKIGKIFHVRASFLQSWLINPNVPLVWKVDKNISGSGALGDLGSHIIDLARFLAGDFDSVMAMEKTFIKSRPVANEAHENSRAADKAAMVDVNVDDSTVFAAEFKNGALGIFEATRFAQGHKNDLSMEINGESGSVKFYFERMNELHYYNANDESGVQGFRCIQASEAIHPYMYAWWPVGHIIGYEHTFVHEFHEFTESIANDKTNPICPSFEDGVKCAQIVEAVELSCNRKAMVTVDEL
jgi:predicted dehydrogenase